MKIFIYLLQKSFQLVFIGCWGILTGMHGYILYRILLSDDKMIASKIAYNCVLHTAFDSFCFIYLLIWGWFLFRKIFQQFSWKSIALHSVVFVCLRTIYRLWWGYFMYFPIFNKGEMC